MLLELAVRPESERCRCRCGETYGYRRGRRRRSGSLHLVVLLQEMMHVELGLHAIQQRRRGAEIQQASRLSSVEAEAITCSIM